MARAVTLLLLASIHLSVDTGRFTTDSDSTGLNDFLHATSCSASGVCACADLIPLPLFWNIRHREPGTLPNTLDLVSPGQNRACEQNSDEHRTN